MTRLRVFLLCQLAFFVVWGGSLMLAQKDADIVWLETAPVDPRDLFSGQYMQLRYPMETPASFGCSLEGTVYVKLESSGTVNSQYGPVTTYKAVSCARKADGPGLWARAERRGYRLEFGIGRFFISEDNPMRNESTAGMLAKVSVNRKGALRILDLAHRK